MAMNMVGLPTMINALDINSPILALNTKFTREMLDKKEAIFLKKIFIQYLNVLIYLKKIL